MDVESYPLTPIQQGMLLHQLTLPHSGPYILGGWSAGSPVALEMAHQLRARGRTVHLVVAIGGALCREADFVRHEVMRFMAGDYAEKEMVFMESFYSALHRYLPKEYTGPVLLYKAQTEPVYHLLEVDLAWRKIAPNLEIVPVKGTHANLIDESHGPSLARDLNERLKEFRKPV
jgi:thioesterase domain-containing protein